MVADFGCGDCKIALSVKNKVHSFDLAPICKLVTVCDMANVSVLCLPATALMFDCWILDARTDVFNATFAFSPPPPPPSTGPS